MAAVHQRDVFVSEGYTVAASMKFRYRVAVYYPNGWERYGGIREFTSKQAAMQHRELLLSLGHKVVHVWKVAESPVAG